MTGLWKCIFKCNNFQHLLLNAPLLKYRSSSFGVHMKIAFIAFFIFLFTAGFLVQPIPLNLLACVTILFLIISTVLDRILIRFANHNRIGIQTEELGMVESVSFHRNALSANWVTLQKLCRTALVFQIIGSVGACLWCGEYLHQLIFIDFPSLYAP